MCVCVSACVLCALGACLRMRVSVWLEYLCCIAVVRTQCILWYAPAGMEQQQRTMMQRLASCFALWISGARLASTKPTVYCFFLLPGARLVPPRLPSYDYSVYTFRCPPGTSKIMCFLVSVRHCVHVMSDGLSCMNFCSIFQVLSRLVHISTVC